MSYKYNSSSNLLRSIMYFIKQYLILIKLLNEKVKVARPLIIYTNLMQELHVALIHEEERLWLGQPESKKELDRIKGLKKQAIFYRKRYGFRKVIVGPDYYKS